MDPKFPDVTVQLTGTDSHALAIVATVSRALRKAGHGDQVKGFVDEATSGDYDGVIRTAMQWVVVA